MQIKSVPSGPDLRHLIKEYAYLSVVPTIANENNHIVIDDGCYDFVFFKGRDVSFKYGQGNNITITNSAFTIHQLKPPHRLVFNHEIEIFVAKVQPWANTIFFPIADESGIINLNQLFPNQIPKLYESIFNSLEMSEAIFVFEEFIKTLYVEENEDFKTIRSVCEKIYETQGAIQVNELVDIFKMNRQLLNKKFKQQVHYTIKQFIKIVRIMAFIKFKIDHPQVSLTEAAYQFNYTDQAHFNNDFKKVCGVSPLSFFKNLPVFFQRHKK